MNHSAPPARELTQIGHYAILDSIGRGGMGLVYLARDTRLDRLVAIKCLRSELFEPLYRERFKREALLLAKLNHPHIVQIYDFIETPEQLGLVMEFVDGQNLQRYLREQIVPFSQRMQWLTQIAQGLAIAHDAGIIHRDLKAENILINKRGEAKISDLGIAKSQDFNMTLTEHVTGSYASMSPEQAVGEELDFRSDLFSFGILAYQLLCGAHPFGDTNNKLQLLQRIISHPPTSPSKHNPDLPSEISDLLGQLLSKNPAKRPANTHWLAAQCEKLSQLALTSAPEADNTPVFLYPASDNDLKNNTTGNYSTNHSGMHKYHTGSTREHATFDTHFIRVPLTHKIRSYVQHHKTQISGSCAILLLIAGLAFWQLRPQQPRYIAVLPPTLSTSEMHESQQELVKAAVYDAIQQSVLQLDDYYLIPRDEIADINADNNKEGSEIVRRATAADELITTDIQCKIEACTITLSRLTANDKSQDNRLRVQDKKTIDVLTDNYLSVATIIQNNLGGLYSEKFQNIFEKIDEQDYAKFLALNTSFREKGTSQQLLDNIDKLQRSTKNLSAVQTLYTEAALDLHNTTRNPSYLQNLERYINSNASNSDEPEYLHNLYYLQIAQKDLASAEKSTEKLKQLNTGAAAINELQAYKMMALKDYESAVKLYSKANDSKTTANNLFSIAKAYWYSGNTTMAKNYIAQSLNLSPNYYKSQNLLGLISLVDGDIDNAAIAFEKTIQQKPDEVSDISNLGLCYLLQGKHAEASKLFNRAFSLAPQYITLALNIADAENLAGNSREANNRYQQIIAAISTIKSTDITSEDLRSLAQANAHLGNFSAALTALQQLEKIDLQNIETTYTAALVHTLANNNASAILNVENALKNGMNKIWFNFSWFDLLCKDNKFIALLKNYGEPERCSP